MGAIHKRRWTIDDQNINPAAYLRAAIYLILIVLVLLGGFLTISFIRLDRQEEAEAINVTDVPFLACHFTNTGAESIPAYSVPLADPLFEMMTVRTGVPFLVLNVHAPTGLLFIQTDHNLTGYVDPFKGMTTGKCGAESVPRDATPLTDFSTVCVFTANAGAAIYADSALMGEARVLDGGEVFILLAQNSAGDYLYGETVNGLSGWLSAAAGERKGACDALRVDDSA